MPIEVMALVLDAETGLSLAEKATLLALANHGSPDGTNVRPGLARLSGYLETPERTVRRYVKHLEQLGWIEQLAPAKPKQHLAAEYRINVDRLAASARSAANGEGQHRPPIRLAPANLASSTGQSYGRPDVINPNVKTEPSKSFASVSFDSIFDEFWRTYPRHVGRPKAVTAFGRAIHRAPPDVILEGARRYRDDPNREDDFTAHPTTWLNRDGWDDDPIPSRNGNGNGKVGVNAILGAADVLRQREEGHGDPNERGSRAGGDASRGVSDLPVDAGGRRVLGAPDRRLGP